MSSTQRSESTHNAIKHHTSASSLLVDLGETLVQYSQDVDRRAFTKLARSIILATARNYSSSVMPIIASLENKISKHAMDILKGQQAQVLCYKMKEITSPSQLANMGLYHVWRGQIDDLMSSGSSSNVVNERIHEDFGLPLLGCGQRTRVTTLTTCSCQFNCKWGLPCRHMLYLYMQQQIDIMPEGVVKPIWFNLAAEDITTKKRELLRILPPEPHEDGAFHTPSRNMTQQERYSFLLQEAKSVIEVASRSDESMEEMLLGLDATMERLQQMTMINELATNNPALPARKGRPQTKRIESSGKIKHR